MRSAAILEIDRWKTMSQCARNVARKQDIECGIKRFTEAAEMTVEAWTRKEKGRESWLEA
jgi:hypothetical protein